MRSVKEIKAPVVEEMRNFESHFRDSMKSDVALLDKITHYVVKRKGKQMRPLFVFLTAKVCGQVSEATYVAASLIELLHTATLVHDDVVDDSNERRGFFSLNAIWKNKIAVLVGDYLLAKGLLLSVDKNQHQLLRLVSDAVREMSEGELRQMEKSRKLDITEPIYFEIIRQKTASLIASCCACGAASVGMEAEDVERMRRFGELTGLAFQIKDDIFDYGDGKNIGKPTGIDIKERKMTLPLIYALNKASKKERKRIINTIKNHNEDKERVKELIAYVIESGGIDYAVEKMMDYRKQAIELLHTFEESEARNSLEGLVMYTTERTK